MSATFTRAKPRITSAFKQLMSVHWVMALCYIVLFTGGTLMAQMPQEVPIRSALFDFHKSIGILTIGLLTWRILVLLRVWWRKYTKRFPKFTIAWLRTVTLHMSLYLFMWAVPVTGVYLSNSYRSQNVKFFGIALPDFFPQNAAARELGGDLHFWVSYTFLAFVVLHTIAQWKTVQANWRRFLGFVRAKSAMS